MKHGEGTIFVFIGPPGSGKGTLAQACVDRWGWAMLSTGALCRQHISQQTEIGEKIDFIIKSGKLIPDDLVTSMVDSWLSEQLKVARNVILDGYPRTKEQLIMFLDMIRSKYKNVALNVVKFEVHDDVVVKRLSSRLVCQNKSCQRVYSTQAEANLMPAKSGICDVCGTSLVQREDDKPEVIKDRLAVFHIHDPSSIFIEKGYRVDLIDASKPFEFIIDKFSESVKREIA